jgi:hypothetical protein
MFGHIPARFHGSYATRARGQRRDRHGLRGFGASRAWQGHSLRMTPLANWQGRDHIADSVAHKRLGWRCSNRLQYARSAAIRSALCLLPHSPPLPQRRAHSGSRVRLNTHSAANLELHCAHEELQASNEELETLNEVRVRRHAVWLLRSGHAARVAAQVVGCVRPPPPNEKPGMVSAGRPGRGPAARKGGR